MSQYLNESWVSNDQCVLSVFDITVLRGFGVFDFLRTYGRRPFLAADHADRFLASAQEVGLVCPKSKEELLQLVDEGISRNPSFPELYIKFILTGGVSDDGISPNPSKSSLILLFSKAGTYAPECFTEGIQLMSVQHERYLPRVKSLNYMPAVLSLQIAKKKGSQELLYISESDEVLEGGTVNFFGVLDGIVHTAEENILFGVTRKFLLHLAKESGISVSIGAIHKPQLRRFEEAFISSTTREVMPVTSIDGTPVGNGKVGPITQKLMDALAKAKSQQ